MSVLDVIKAKVGGTRFEALETEYDGSTVKLWFRTMTGPERQKFDATMIGTDKKGQPFYKHGEQKQLLIAMTLLKDCPPSTELAFSSVAELANMVKDADFIDDMYAVTGKLNGFITGVDDAGTSAPKD